MCSFRFFQANSMWLNYFLYGSNTSIYVPFSLPSSEPYVVQLLSPPHPMKYSYISKTNPMWFNYFHKEYPMWFKYPFA
jgi:hypothetical protein